MRRVSFTDDHFHLPTAGFRRHVSGETFHDPSRSLHLVEEHELPNVPPPDLKWQGSAGGSLRDPSRSMHFVSEDFQPPTTTGLRWQVSEVPSLDLRRQSLLMRAHATYSSRMVSPKLKKALRKQSGWRLRSFARLAKTTQHPYFLAMIYFLIFATFVTPVVVFLHYTASQGSNVLDFDETPVAEINLALVGIYGLRNMALLFLAVGCVHDRTILVPLAFDVAVWIINIVVWILVVRASSYDEDNVHLLSIAGLLGALQLNSFMLLNAVLGPLVQSKGGTVYQREDTVSVQVVTDLIQTSNIPAKRKNILKAEVYFADYDHERELDSFKFFDFSNKAMVWFERWTTEEDVTSSMNSQNKASRNLGENKGSSFSDSLSKFQLSRLWSSRKTTRVVDEDLKELFSKLQFSNLVQATDNAFLSAKKQLDPNEDEDADETSDTDENVIDALLITVSHLTTGQQFRALSLFFFVTLMACTQYLYFYIAGDLLNFATQMADDAPVEDDFHRNLIFLAIVLLVNVATYYITSYLAATLISSATARLKREFVERVLYSTNDCRPAAITNTFSASLVKAEAVWNELQYNLVFPLAALFAAVLFFCILDVGYAMFTLAAIPIVFSCQHVLSERATLTSDRFTASSSKLLGQFQNLVGIQKASKLYQNQDFLRDRIDLQLSKTQRDHASSLWWGNVFGAVFNSVGSLLLGVTNVVLLFAVSTGAMSAGEFFSLMYFVNGVIKPLEQLGIFSGRVAFYSGAIQDIERLLQQEMDEKDDDDEEGDKSEEPESYITARQSSLTLEKDLSLEEVWFQYGPDLPPVLQDLSFTISSGTYSCIYGHSGCGKSTVLGLLEGFHECTEGRICMDGVDINSVSLSKLRNSLGVVFQSTYVLDGSIYENIAFGYNCSMDQVVRAARDANIHGFIESLPNGYDTVIGLEADISLSGGQLQRICGLARALLRKPALLILDEATSALDKISEQVVMDTLISLRDKGMTIVSVSHHPSNALEADKVIVLMNGSIEQAGTYQELVEVDGTFADFVNADSGAVAGPATSKLEKTSSEKLRPSLEVSGSHSSLPQEPVILEADEEADDAAEDVTPQQARVSWLPTQSSARGDLLEDD